MIGSKLGSDVDTLVVGAGQAGLAAGIALQRAGLSFMIVDAADQPGGSWARYYDSLTLFSPSWCSPLPGLRSLKCSTPEPTMSFLTSPTSRRGRL